jgi:hypothetical protein
MELLILFLLQIKHWYFDFANQSADEIKYKGIYLDWRGITHSLKHAIATVALFFLFTSVHTAIILGLIDFLIHYHIDWIKIKWGTKDISTKLFWNQFGLDQLAHQTTYIVLILLFNFY